MAPPNPLGTAHRRPADAYRDVPILAQPTWNHEIAAYFYLGGVASGATLLGTLADLVGGSRLSALARTAHVVGLLALLPCPPLLIDDLGRPERFHHMLRVFKPLSPMNVGSWTLTLDGGMAALAALRALGSEASVPWLNGLARRVPLRLVALLGLPPALTLAGYPGVLLGTTSIPAWAESPLLGGLFAASAFVTGTAATSLAGSMTHPFDRPAQDALETIGLCSGLVELALTGGFLATSGPAARPLVEGRGAALTALSVGLTAAGIVLGAASRNAGHARRPLSALGSLSTLVAGAALRWGVVRAGHASAADRATQLALQS
ncbi:MAG: polysulfide reductase NrfD [Chloroflexi bacterium]|nr:polysulfide reductase NrfD [Chloroflexota bacterium]